MAGRGTTRRVIRVGDGLWERFGQASQEAGMDRTAAIRAFMLWFTGYPGAELPAKPVLSEDVKDIQER